MPANWTETEPGKQSLDCGGLMSVSVLDDGGSYHIEVSHGTIEGRNNFESLEAAQLAARQFVEKMVLLTMQQIGRLESGEDAWRGRGEGFRAVTRTLVIDADEAPDVAGKAQAKKAALAAAKAKLRSVLAEID